MSSADLQFNATLNMISMICWGYVGHNAETVKASRLIAFWDLSLFKAAQQMSF